MGNILGMSIYTPSHWSVFSFCGLLGFESDLYLGGGDGWARRSNNGVDASNPNAATGSFSGSAAGAKCVCCVENMGEVEADDLGLRPHWLSCAKWFRGETPSFVGDLAFGCNRG